MIETLRNRASRWVSDTRGNVAVMFGVSLLPVMIAIGISIDYGQGAAVHQKLAGTVDSIALAAARVHDDPQMRQTIGEKFLSGNLGGYGAGVEIQDLIVEFDDEAKTVTVRVIAKIPTHLMSIAGIDDQIISSESTVSYEGHVSEPVSLGLVLDVSGSMRWNGKIGTLRTAATHLLDKLAAADPDNVYVRTGLVTYHSQIRHTVTMDWGIDHTRSVVQGLYASGGTASTTAVDLTGGWLTSAAEQTAHEAQEVHEGEEFELHRFMIFMTDGDNNYNADDDATEELCDEIKAGGVEIFSVAFDAPHGGRQLLQYCASSEEHYFDAQNSQDFLAAFEAIGDRIESAFLRIVE
jgi:Flp pilus assembly protein TadG